MADKYIMLNLDDEKIKKVADVISNETSKKILNLLAEKELSETEIAEQLKVPVNTIEYNLKKLIEVGLVDKTKDFFWSLKGKKIPKYTLSKKDILISTKNKLNIWPSVIIMGIATVGIDLFEKIRMFSFSRAAQTSGTNVMFDESAKMAASGAETAIQTTSPQSIQSLKEVLITPPSETAMWFLLGWLFILLILTLWNHRKVNPGGFSN